MNSNEDWAQPENPAVEEGKDAFATAQNAALLRQQISDYAAFAVTYGNVNREWVNQSLDRLGAKPVTGEAEYRLNVPVTGLFGMAIRAHTRVEALAKFNARLEQAKQVNDCHHRGYNVYGLAFDGSAPTFYSGPEDPQPVDDDAPVGDALRVGIRDMLKQAVAGQGWGYSYAQNAAHVMGLAPLPALVHRSVNVPVSGTVAMDVAVFEGDDDDAVQQAAMATIGRRGSVLVTPEEVGAAYPVRSDLAESMGLKVVDDAQD